MPGRATPLHTRPSARKEAPSGAVSSLVTFTIRGPEGSHARMAAASGESPSPV